MGVAVRILTNPRMTATTMQPSVGNDVADAQHAPLAVEHGASWISKDRGFARFPGMRWRHPLD